MIILPVMLEGVASRKDSTYIIRLGTQELPAHKAAELLTLSNKYAFAAIKAEEFSKEEIQEMESADMTLEGKNQKSRSERLRSVLYLLWKEEGHQTGFDSYYESQMETIIGHFKAKLPPR